MSLINLIPLIHSLKSCKDLIQENTESTDEMQKLDQVKIRKDKQTDKGTKFFSYLVVFFIGYEHSIE